MAQFEPKSLAQIAPKSVAQIEPKSPNINQQFNFAIISTKSYKTNVFTFNYYIFDIF